MLSESNIYTEQLFVVSLLTDFKVINCPESIFMAIGRVVSSNLPLYWNCCITIEQACIEKFVAIRSYFICTVWRETLAGGNVGEFGESSVIRQTKTI